MVKLLSFLVATIKRIVPELSASVLPYGYRYNTHQFLPVYAHKFSLKNI